MFFGIKSNDENMFLETLTDTILDELEMDVIGEDAPEGLEGEAFFEYIDDHRADYDTYTDITRDGIWYYFENIINGTKHRYFVPIIDFINAACQDDMGRYRCDREDSK